MKQTRKRVNALEAAAKSLEAAKARVAEFSGGSPADKAVDEALRLVREQIGGDRARLAAMEREVYGSGPILQVSFRSGVKSMRIVVAKPDREHEDAYISSVQFEVMRRYLGCARESISADADFSVAIVGAQGIVEGIVTRDGTKFL